MSQNFVDALKFDHVSYHSRENEFVFSLQDVWFEMFCPNKIIHLNRQDSKIISCPFCKSNFDSYHDDGEVRLIKSTNCLFLERHINEIYKRFTDPEKNEFNFSFVFSPYKPTFVENLRFSLIRQQQYDNNSILIWFKIEDFKYTLLMEKHPDKQKWIPTCVDHPFDNIRKECPYCGKWHGYCDGLEKYKREIFHRLIEYPPIRLEWLYLDYL